MPSHVAELSWSLLDPVTMCLGNNQEFKNGRIWGEIYRV